MTRTSRSQMISGAQSIWIKHTGRLGNREGAVRPKAETGWSDLSLTRTFARFRRRSSVTCHSASSLLALDRSPLVNRAAERGSKTKFALGVPPAFPGPARAGEADVVKHIIMRAPAKPASSHMIQEFARAVFDLRKARGWTQRQLAAKSGIQQAEISRIEAGNANPTLSTIAVLADALGAELSLGERGGRHRVSRPSSPAREARRSTRFLCLVCADKLLEQMPRAAADRHLAQYRVVTERLRKRGALLACNRLLPAERAVTVRVRKGRRSVTDGPFAETKELVGGYFVIEAEDRAEAVRLASTLPGARIGCVEVRPIAEDAATLRALGLPAASRAG
jgi:DNA-binding XRE family transcriptional regulator